VSPRNYFIQYILTFVFRKHSLTLQLHTAQILSAHSSLEQRNKKLEDVKAEKTWLESERARLLECLREVNEDREKVRANVWV
jgi:predicted transcriptional regulator